MQKIINSNTAKYQPMLTDNLVLDDKPTVNSFNTVTSDGVARAIAGASGEVPAVTESDNGKVLTAVYDEGGAAVEWAEAQGGGTDLPELTGNAGKVLAVNSGATGVEWVAPLDYTMVYNTTPAGGSYAGEPWDALNAGKRIGCLVPYSAFSGSLAAGSKYNSGKIYMPLASVVDRSSGEFRWNFYLYDGANKWSLALTCDEDVWSWGTPNVTPG